MPKYRLVTEEDAPESGQVTDQGFMIGEDTGKTKRFKLAFDEDQREPTAPDMTVGRAAGLGARVGLQAIPSAVAGLPALAMDAYDSLRNATAMGMNTLLPKEYEQPLIPPFRHSGMVADVGEQMADAAGTPRPVGKLESGLVGLGTAGASAVGGAGLYGAGARALSGGAAPIAANVGAQVSRTGMGALRQAAADAEQFVATAQNAVGPTTQMVLQELGRGPLMQGLSSVGGAYASDIAREMGAPPALILGAGMVGGAATGLGVTGATRTGGAGRALVRPFTAAGRDVIAGRVLNRLATNPIFAREQMENFVELVPGSQPTMSQVSRDPGLIAAETGFRNTLDTGVAPGGGNRIGQRLSEQNSARQAYLGRVARDEQTLERATAKRDRTFDEEAAPAFREKSPVGVDPAPVLDLITQIRRSPRGVQQPVQQALTYAEQRLTQRGVDLTDPEVLYEVRKDLANAARGRYSGDASNMRHAAGELMTVVRRLDRIIENGAPGYARYMRLYERRSIPIDQMTGAQNIRTGGQVTARDPVSREPTLSNGRFQTAMQRAARNGDMDRMTEGQIRTIQRVADDLDRGAAPTTNVAKVPGSDSMRNFSIANVIGRILGDNVPPEVSAVGQKLLAPLSWFYSMPDEQIGQLLVDAALDPRLAASLMRRATEASVEDIARELAWRSRNSAVSASVYPHAAE